MTNYIYLLSNILLLVVGQILFKIGLQQIEGVSLSTLWKAAMSIYILLGLFAYVIATALWFIVLSRMPLSIAYPSQSLAYVLGIIAAWGIFDESFDAMKLIGIILIVVGVIVISK